MTFGIKEKSIILTHTVTELPDTKVSVENSEFINKD